MKTLLSLLIFPVIAGLTACNNSNSTAEVPLSTDTAQAAQQDDTAAKKYLPVADFIKGDIGLVDSFAAGIVLKTELGAKKDSSFIRPAQFKQLAAEFLAPEFDSATFHKLFTETLLADPAGNGMAFMYTTNDAASSVRKVIVYVVSGELAEKVNRIYIEKEQVRGDTSISQKLTWKMKEYLIIAENKQTSGGYNVTQVRKAIWDPQRFGE